MYTDNLLYCLTLAVLCQISVPCFSEEVYEVLTNVSLRETTIDATDFTCGDKFCNKSLSRYFKLSCFSCTSCYCDDDCVRYGDCCPDVLFNSEDTVIQPSEFISCQEKYVKRSIGYDIGTIFMYTLCPHPFTDLDIKNKCEEPSMYSIDEVTLVSVGNDTYRNKYCAVCHGQDSHMTWLRSVECQSGDILKSASDKTELWKLVLEDIRCKISPIVPEGTTLRICESGSDVIDTCNISKSVTQPDPRSEQLCGMYNHLIKYEKRWYQNIFCAICNGVELIREDCENSEIEIPRGVGNPLSVLIDFNPKPRRIFSAPELMDDIAEPVTRVQCNESSIYDPFTGSCRKALCSFGRIFSEGSCDVIFQSARGLGYSGSVSLTYPKPLPKSTWTDILVLYEEKLKVSLESYKPFIFPRISTGIVFRTELSEGPHRLLMQTFVGARLDFDFVSRYPGNQLSLEEDLKKVHELEIKFVHGDENHTLTTQARPCQEDPEDGRTNDETIHWTSTRTPMFFLCDGICLIDKVVYTPVFSIIECPFLEFNLSTLNHTVNPNNLSIEYDNQTFHFASYEYHICAGMLQICSSSLSTITETLAQQELILDTNSVNQSYTTNSILNRVSVSPELAIVSISCIVLSLVCLFLTFSVYCLLPFLRTLPGKNTMILVFYLFSAQLLFQVGNRLNYDQKLCQAMGVLIHYLWVATFTSMGVCAFHMYRVFTKLSRSTFSGKAEESKILALYLFVINLVPVVVVGICVAYRAGTSRGVDIGYGGDICFLVLPMDIGIFFGAPLGFILIFNTCCFFRVVLAIRNVTDMEVTKNKANRNHLNVYFRLSVLLGFAWIFGFIAAATQFEPLWYVFVVLNGLQGVFVFVAYCVNSRTWGMIRDTYCCKQSEKYKLADQISTPTPSTVTSNL